ncbi:thioredoxin family protein [soil metagenome]
MRQALLLLVVATLAGFSGAPAFAAKPPVVVELFTAQGCSSCGKANQVVADLADDKGVLALTYSVDYWDYLGWSDTFAKPAFAARQRAYAQKFSLRDVPTPQVVVGGRQQASGAKAEAVETLVKDAAKAPTNAPDMEFIGDGNRVAVGSGPVPRGGAEVWLVRYDPREQDIAIKRGDNRGQTLVHRNVVRELVKLGPWSGRPKLYRLPEAKDDDLKTVIIVQGAKGGRVIGVLQEAAEK